MVYQFGPSGKELRLPPCEPLQPRSPNPVEPLRSIPSSNVVSHGQGLRVPDGILAASLLVGQALVSL